MSVKGGHGAVYRAQHTETGKDYAIKVILPEHENDSTLLVRFQQEAEIIRDLNHPHIVHLEEFWEDEYGMWVVMQWLGGGDLRQYLEAKGKMPPKTLAKILTQITGALDETHAANIIHRDLKPDNIVLDEKGAAYLTDFGIAKRIGYKPITSLGIVVGSPNYLSPEQILGETVSARTDVFALGFTIYEMLIGQHPFHHIRSRVQLMMAIMQQDIPVMTDLDPKIVADINGLIQRATNKQTDKRYPTASALSQHFSQIVGAC
ncbi:MAG: serine/threonine-protein kinase [Anaerolineae bacterium]|nr:serine/threonine-protein kinase [Anaerolineae bacterium]